MPGLLLLALPFDAADRIFALRWRRRLSRALEFLCALAGDLKDAVTRHRLDQELGQRPVATENRIRDGADAAMVYPRFGMLDLLKLLSGLLVGAGRTRSAGLRGRAAWPP